MSGIFRSHLIMAAVVCLAAVGLVACDKDTSDDVKTVILDRCPEAIYFGKFFKEEEHDNYWFLLSDDDLVFDQGFNRVAKHVGGNLLSIDLWTEIRELDGNVLIPEGEYPLSEDRKPSGYFAHTKNTYSHLTTVYTGTQMDYAVTDYKSGKVCVKHTEKGYEIKADLVTEDGKTKKFFYEGPIVFDDKSPKPVDDHTIRENFEVKPVKVTDQTWEYGTNYENHLVRLFESEKITNDGRHINTVGNKLQLELYSAPGKGIAGAYKITDNGGVKAPGVLCPGGRLGLVTASGTHVERVRDDNTIAFCAFVDGSLTISENAGGTYTFKGEFVSKEGYTVTVDWTGKVEDYVFRDPPQTTLTGDVHFMPQELYITHFADYPDRSLYWLEFVTSKATLIVDITTQLNLSKTEFATGTYMVTPVKDALNSVYEGLIEESGSAVPTIYAEIENDEVVNEAPITGGRIVITKDAAGKYVFDFDFLDDANREDKTARQNRIYGSWTGRLPEIKEYYPEG